MTPLRKHVTATTLDERLGVGEVLVANGAPLAGVQQFHTAGESSSPRQTNGPGRDLKGNHHWAGEQV